MGVNGLGDITGLAADMEMYITDPESRTWFNAMMSGAGVAGGAVSISPSMAAMLPIIRKNIDAWQGSPHKFDRMSSAHIGTGEGAQAYGHGLYFAEQKGIGEGYRDALSSEILVDGKPISNQTNDYMEKKLLEAGFDPDKAIDLINAEIDPSDISKIGKIRQEGATSAIDRLTDLKARDAIQTQEGYLYNVDLKVDPDDLLDWDAPLSEQSEAIRAALSDLPNISDEYEVGKGMTGYQLYDKKTGYLDTDYNFGSEQEANDFLNAKMTGGDYYQWLSGGNHGPLQAEVSGQLKDRGIPGIRYLDGSSRSAGEGTRNFVIFDDSLIEIKTRNGEALTPVQRQEAVTSMTSGFSDSTSYRGMTQPYDESKVSNIIWTTDNPKYAGEYASRDGAFGGNIMPLNVKAENPFNFGFRNISTEVKYGDVLDRVRRGIDDAFTNNSIGREEGINLMDKLEDLRDSADLSEMRPVHGWWNNNYELTDILKSAGYDGISAKEGINNNIQTIGVFNKNQVRSIFDKEAGAGEMMGGDTARPRLPDAPEGRTRLYNAGTLDRDPSGWLEPHVSDWVREVAEGAGDVPVDDITTPLVYLSDEPGSWVKSIVSRKLGKNDVTIDDIRRHGRLSVFDIDPEDDEIFKVGDYFETQKVTDLQGRERDFWDTPIYNEGDVYTGEGRTVDMPVGPEPNDFISNQAQEITHTLTGDELIGFLDENQPELMSNLRNKK
jgi:hypothetical protein